MDVWHHDDVIMGAITSQITNPAIVYSIVYSDAHQGAVSLAFVREFTAQKARNAENVFIWLRHHE